MNTIVTQLTQQEIDILRKYRDQIVDFFKERKIYIPEHINISAAGQRNSYLIQITTVNGRTSLTKYSDSLNVMFNLKPTNSSHSILIFNFKEKVLEEIKKNLPEQIPKKAEVVEKEEVKDLKENELDFDRATLLNEIRQILVNVMPSEDLKKPYILKKYMNNKDIAEIQVPDEYIRNKVLFTLETQGYLINEAGVRVIATRKEKLFNDIPNPNFKEKELCQKFLSSLKKWMEENKVIGEIRTHAIFLANSNFTKELEIQCEDSQSAMLIEKVFITNKLNPRKINKMVYVILNLRVLNTPFIEPHIDPKELEVYNRGLDYKSSEGHQSYTKLSNNYNEFNLLSFNRKIDQSHAEGIGKSIDEFGVVDFVKVVETDCIDGKMKKWIVDGQHTFTAMKKRNLPIVYVLIKVNTLYDVVRLIAVLNNRRKLWNNKDYLNAWLSLKVPIYQKIEYWMKEKLQISLILEAFSGKNRTVVIKDFKDGSFYPTNLRAEDILEDVKHLKNYLPKHAGILLNLQRFISKTENFDRNQMLLKLKDKKSEMNNIFSVDDIAETIERKLSEIYYS